MPAPSLLARSAAACGAVLLCLGAGPPAAAEEPAAESGRYAQIDRYVRGRMAEMGTPGLAYAVVGTDGPLHQRAWGTDGSGAPVTPETPFLWGSAAKPVAATAVMALVEQGALCLDDPVTEWVPGFSFGGPAHAAAVTVRHLLSQTSGLPEESALAVADCDGDRCPRPAERVGALDGYEPVAAPGAEHTYTSANYVVLAAVVESATGMDYAEHLRRAVLAPAGMDHAVYDAASARERRPAPGHQYLWGVPAPIGGGFDPHGAAYGYLGGDLGDLSAFASLILRNGRAADGARVLSPASVAQMHTAQARRSDPSPYALGWRLGLADALEEPLEGVVWHGGATPGYAAQVILFPERGIAVVMQQNLHELQSDDAVMKAGYGAARILAGERPAPPPGTGAYTATVAGTSVLALALVACAVRSVAVMRRPRPGATALRRGAGMAGWVLLAAVPWTALALAVGVLGIAGSVHWAPDGFAALCLAAAAGAVTVAARGATALRAP